MKWEWVCTQGVARCTRDISQKNQQKIEITRGKCGCKCMCDGLLDRFYSQTSCIQRMFAKRHDTNKNSYMILPFFPFLDPM